VGREHAWFARRTVAVAELAEQHVWADAGAFKSDSLLGRALLTAGNVRPRKLTPVPMTGAVPLEMARANLGITVMPRWAVEPAFAAGDLRAVRFGARGLWLRWSVATRAEVPEPSLAAFLEALRRHHPRAPEGAARQSRSRSNRTGP
jgi:LysR family transcriptional regulator for metE and metH